jgi:hypothetical protein
MGLGDFISRTGAKSAKVLTMLLSIKFVIFMVSRFSHTGSPFHQQRLIVDFSSLYSEAKQLPLELNNS